MSRSLLRKGGDLTAEHEKCIVLKVIVGIFNEFNHRVLTEQKHRLVSHYEPTEGGVNKHNLLPFSFSQSQ